MALNKSKTSNMVFMNGFKFKKPVHVNENFELYHLKHTNLGLMTVQVVPKEKSVEHIFCVYEQGVNLKSRYCEKSHFTTPIFTYLDEKYEYNVFYKFVTLGEIVAQRIVKSAPEEAIEEFKLPNEVEGPSGPRIPASSEYEEFETAAEICAYYESQTGKSVFSKINSYEMKMMLKAFFKNSRRYEEYFKLEDFDIHRYCFLTDSQFKHKIRSDLQSYDRTITCVAGNIQKKNETLLNFATHLFRQISPTFTTTLINNSYIKKSEGFREIWGKIKMSLQKKNNGMLDLDYVYPWLTHSSGFFLCKILDASSYNDPYYSTMLWYNFFGGEYHYDNAIETAGVRKTLFHVMKCGVTNCSEVPIEYDHYVRNYLPNVIRPNHDHLAVRVEKENIARDKMKAYKEDKCEDDFQRFKMDMEKPKRYREVWERLS